MRLSRVRLAHAMNLMPYGMQDSLNTARKEHEAFALELVTVCGSAALSVRRTDDPDFEALAPFSNVIECLRIVEKMPAAEAGTTPGAKKKKPAVTSG